MKKLWWVSIWLSVLLVTGCSVVQSHKVNANDAMNVQGRGDDGFADRKDVQHGEANIVLGPLAVWLGVAGGIGAVFGVCWLVRRHARIARKLRGCGDTEMSASTSGNVN